MTMIRVYYCFYEGNMCKRNGRLFTSVANTHSHILTATEIKGSLTFPVIENWDLNWKLQIALLPSATKLRRLCFYRRLSVHRGVSASVHAGIPHKPPQEQTPPQSRPPWEQTPREQTPPLQQTPYPGADTPQEQTPPRETATAADGTHPTGMHSCSNIFLQLLDNA